MGLQLSAKKMSMELQQAVVDEKDVKNELNHTIVGKKDVK